MYDWCFYIFYINNIKDGKNEEKIDRYFNDFFNSFRLNCLNWFVRK